jgi:hypothetical protein
MKKKRGRAGATETLSVSVDMETKRALRALASSDFDGNFSALITDLAEEACRRVAAAAYLRRHRIAKPSKPEADVLQTTIDREVAAFKQRRRRRGVA